jgi:hypothetical protein
LIASTVYAAMCADDRSGATGWALSGLSAL